MPKTKLHQSSKAPKQSQPVSTTNDPLSDLEIPDSLRKDLSYPATKAKRQMTLDHLEAKLQKRFEEINANLKTDGVKVQLQKIGNSVVLQFSALLREGDKPTIAGRSTKQYKLGVGCGWSADGLTLAESYARQIGHRLLHKSFTWDWFDTEIQKRIEPKDTPKLISELLEQFEGKYFETRKRTRQSEGTFGKYSMYLNARLPKDKTLTDDVIKQTILKTETGSGARVALVESLSVFCNTFEYEFNFKGYKDGYEPKKKILPSDEEIVEYHDTFRPNKYHPEYQWEAWRWMYGILATYGLRIHEVWAIDLDKFLDPSNTDNLIVLDEKITNGLKTGERILFPLHPHWLELFDLKNVRMPKLVCNLEQKTTITCARFRDSKIPFTPHTLRHCYAVRGHVLEIPLKVMADAMGHTIEIHTNTYQKYMDETTKKVVFHNAINKAKGKLEERTEVEILKAEITKLREENEKLKTELRLMRELTNK